MFVSESHVAPAAQPLGSLNGGEGRYLSLALLPFARSKPVISYRHWVLDCLVFLHNHAWHECPMGGAGAGHRLGSGCVPMGMQTGVSWPGQVHYQGMKKRLCEGSLCCPHNVWPVASVSRADPVIALGFPLTNMSWQLYCLGNMSRQDGRAFGKVLKIWTPSPTSLTGSGPFLKTSWGLGAAVAGPILGSQVRPDLCSSQLSPGVSMSHRGYNFLLRRTHNPFQKSSPRA